MHKKKNIDDFSGAPKWCFNFMKREGLSVRSQMKLGPKQQPLGIKFWNFILISSIFERLTTLNCPKLPNMDEALLTFDDTHNRTVDVKGAKAAAVKTSGHEKIHFTVVLACCADGTKLPPTIIFKRKMFLKEKIPSGVIVHTRENRWMNEEGMKNW